MSAIKAALGKIGSLAPYVLSFIIGFSITTGVGYLVFFAPVDKSQEEEMSFIVEKGANWRSVANDLEDKGFVRSWMGVYFPLWLKNISPILEPGEYRLKKSYTPARIIEAIRKREIVFRSVTFPEGTEVKDYPRILASTTLVTEAEVKKAMGDPSLRHKYYIPDVNIEGYLFPSTYKFTRPINAKQMLSQIMDQGVKLWTKERSEKAVTLGLSYHQVLTLASMIQKEAGNNEEMPTISSVFHNRLSVGMKLESDPTVIYGLPDFNGNLTRKDLLTPHPYNTYLNQGLPPTPICNPGLAAIDAALNPEKTSYIYFVSKGNNTHQFSETKREHEAAVQKYQKNPGQQ